MAREYFSVRLPTELIAELREEAKKRKETVTHIIEERIAIASTQNATLTLDFGGVRIPVKVGTKKDLVEVSRK